VDTAIQAIEALGKQQLRGFGGFGGGAQRKPARRDGGPRPEPVGGIRAAAQRTQASNNFKQLALGFHNAAAETGGQMPGPILDPTGRPLHSWRVAILPYLGPQEKALFNRIRRNEPWNSAYNQQFHNQMPKVFEVPYLFAGPGQTYTQVFTGPNTPFVNNRGPRMAASFPDGTSNTILVAEAAQSVPWMAPQDINYNPQGSPRSQLGRGSGQGPLVALADGSVRTIAAKVSDQTLHAAITPAGGELLGPDW
jgi:hypothetical protein